MTTLKPQILGSGRRPVIIGNYKLVQMTAQHPNRNGLRVMGNIDEAWGNSGQETQNGEFKQWE